MNDFADAKARKMSPS